MSSFQLVKAVNLLDHLNPMHNLPGEMFCPYEISDYVDFYGKVPLKGHGDEKKLRWEEK